MVLVEIEDRRRENNISISHVPDFKFVDGAGDNSFLLREYELNIIIITIIVSINIKINNPTSSINEFASDSIIPERLSESTWSMDEIRHNFSKHRFTGPRT